MKHVLLWVTTLCLLCLAFPAHAWCTLPPPAQSASGTPVQETQLPAACVPPVAGYPGDGRGYLQRDFPAVPGATSNGGSCWGWWCPNPTFPGGWQMHTYCGLDKYLPGTANPAVLGAFAASSPLAAVQSIFDRYTVKVNAWVETHDYNCLHEDMRTALLMTKPAPVGAPPPAVWHVPGHPPTTYGIYDLSTGKVGAYTGRRVPGATLCNCAVRVPSGSQSYCALSAAPTTEGALCETP